jgi:hypothetical protein
MTTDGQSWQRAFKGLPDEARAVRQWTRGRLAHPDSEQVANELFTAILGSRPDVITVTLSTAGRRLRITATGPAELPARLTHGPGRQIIRALSALSGVTPDSRGMWALLVEE